MPNWCANHLAVTGARDELLEFLATASGNDPIVGDAARAARAIDPSNEDAITHAVLNAQVSANKLTFNGHAPEPDSGGYGLDANGVERDWYSWRLEHWGVKWDLSEPAILELSHVNGDDQGSPWRIAIEFQTPWGPPYVWLDTVRKRHPNLAIQMVWNEEQGIGGVFQSTNDTLTHHDLSVDGIRELWEDAPFLWDDVEDGDYDDGLSQDQDPDHLASVKAANEVALIANTLLTAVASGAVDIDALEQALAEEAAADQTD